MISLLCFMFLDLCPSGSKTRNIYMYRSEYAEEFDGVGQSMNESLMGC